VYGLCDLCVLRFVDTNANARARAHARARA
jgi:hypothetical protein